MQKFTFPHSHSDLGTYLDQLCKDESQHLVSAIHKMLATSGDNVMDLKPLIMKSCANIFNRYFCSSNRCQYDDEDFTNYCQDFDQVFWEINNGRAVDFLPWLMPIFKHSSAIATMKKASHNVRNYVKEKIIAPKRARRSSLTKRGDFLDEIMTYIDDPSHESKDDAILTRQSALFALEDILGGHSAVANIILRILFDLALDDNKDSQKAVKAQINEAQPNGYISLEDRPNLPMVVACMHETIRLTCSPIVPHQATQDSTIDGEINRQGFCIPIISCPFFKATTCPRIR